MNPFRTFRVRVSALVCFSLLLFSSVAGATEIFVLPTHQADTGGVGIGNGIWPVSALGVTRLVVAVPADLMAFVGAKIALVPSAPGGAGVLHVFVCTAKNSDLVGAACSGPVDRPFTGVANKLVEVDISSCARSARDWAGCAVHCDRRVYDANASQRITSWGCGSYMKVSRTPPCSWRAALLCASSAFAPRPSGQWATPTHPKTLIG